MHFIFLDGVIIKGLFQPKGFYDYRCASLPLGMPFAEALAFSPLDTEKGDACCCALSTSQKCSVGCWLLLGRAWERSSRRSTSSEDFPPPVCSPFGRGLAVLQGGSW